MYRGRIALCTPMLKNRQNNSPDLEKPRTRTGPGTVFFTAGKGLRMRKNGNLNRFIAGLGEKLCESFAAGVNSGGSYGKYGVFPYKTAEKKQHISIENVKKV